MCGVPAIGRLRYLEAVPPASQRRRGVLVLLHAFPLNARMWEGQLGLADGGWRGIAPPFPRAQPRARGGGRAGAPHFRGVAAGAGDPPTVSIDDYAADVIDLLDALHIDQAVI